MAIWEQEKKPIYFKKQAQIKAQIEALLFNKAFIEVSVKYSDYSNVFSVKNAIKFLKNSRMSDHAIKLEKDKLPPFESIYSLKPVELETLKTYIKINFVNSFI